MRLSLSPLLLLLAAAVLAQDQPDQAENDVLGGAEPTPASSDTPDAEPATPAGEPSEPGGADNINENVNDPTQPWNITYFTYPTRNNYWVNDNENKATWSPVNVASNLMLAHSNSSMLPQRVMLQQNIPGGVGTFATKITGYTPGNNYLLVLTIAGNPDQKLAQSQGFYIKANGTAAPQQVTAQGNQATASAVSNGGSTQPGSGDPNAMQQGNGGGTGGGAPDAGGGGNGSPASPSPNAAAGQSAAARTRTPPAHAALVALVALAALAALRALA